MKKIVFCIATIGALFTSCNPNEDIYNELDAQEDVVVGDVSFALSDDDYDALDLGFGNFNSVEDAKSMIPSLLSDKYPVWGNGSSAIVTFKVYSPKRDERSLIRYTVTTEDYDANPETAQFNNFDDDSQIYDFLNSKYTTPENRTLVSLTYKFYDGSTNTLNNGFLFVDGAWNFVQGFTNDEYNLMGEGFANFSSEDEADAKIPIFLQDKFKYDGKMAGDIEAIMYKLYTTDVLDLDEDGRTDDSTTYSYVKYFVFDGASWSAYTNTVNETIQFGHDGTTWVPDNTIKYALTGNDYAAIVSALSGTYPGPTGSMDSFGNFDRREGNAAFWSDAMVVEALNVVLNNINPGAEDGQKYVVTIDVYNGSNGTEDFAVIKAGGSWVLQ